MSCDAITVDLDADSVDTITEKLQQVAERIGGPAPLGTVKVGAEKLIPALRACLPHAAIDPELPAIRRIRVAVNDGLLVWCTDRYTAAVAHIPANDLPDYDGSIWEFDLLPEDAKLLVDMFTPGKDEVITLEITATRDQVTVADVSGLFEGRTVSVPHPGGGESMPAIPALVRTSLTSTRGKAVAAAHWVFGGGKWRRFTSSAAVLKQPMVIEPGLNGRAPFVVRLGEHFIGLVMPMIVEDDGSQRDIRDAWIDRLPEREEGAAA